MAAVMTPPPVETPAFIEPRLENGDRLTRAEFERRYSRMPHVKRAELIEGKVYMSSPVRIKAHAGPHAILTACFATYAVMTPGVEVADNGTVRLDNENEPQPDVLLRIMPEAGGRTRDSHDDYLEGAPELLAEVASSSVSYDLHEKKRAYRRNGVQEYLVWLVEEKRVEWWELKDEEYVSLPTEENVIKSRVFPGLWLAAAALVRGNSAEVLAQVQKGLASSEHAQFAAGLAWRLKAA
jgi:Uma2 family endonuclease